MGSDHRDTPLPVLTLQAEYFVRMDDVIGALSAVTATTSAWSGWGSWDGTVLVVYLQFAAPLVVGSHACLLEALPCV
jgi:hypothetical protein